MLRLAPADERRPPDQVVDERGAPDVLVRLAVGLAGFDDLPACRVVQVAGGRASCRRFGDSPPQGVVGVGRDRVSAGVLDADQPVPRVVGVLASLVVGREVAALVIGEGAATDGGELVLAVGRLADGDPVGRDRTGVALGVEGARFSSTSQ